MPSDYALATPHARDGLGDRRSDQLARPHAGECSTAVVRQIRKLGGTGLPKEREMSVGPPRSAASLTLGGFRLSRGWRRWLGVTYSEGLQESILARHSGARGSRGIGVVVLFRDEAARGNESRHPPAQITWLRRPTVQSHPILRQVR
jgi:hypothetical protein